LWRQLFPLSAKSSRQGAAYALWTLSSDPASADSACVIAREP